MMKNIPTTLFTVTEVELIYRNKISPKDRPQIKNSGNAYDIFLTVWDMDKIQLMEQFYIMLLDRSNHCLGVSNLFTGGVSACVVDPKLIFSTALKANASSMILAHNHPSGNIQPSRADILLTQKLKNGGDIIEVKVEDHLIITPHTYYSFSDEYVAF